MKRISAISTLALAAGFLLSISLHAEMAQEPLEAGQSSLEGGMDAAQGADLSADAAAEAAMPTPTATPTPRPDCGGLKIVAGDGTPGYNGDDGLGVAARLNGPVGLCFDARGDLYIADRGNNVVRELDRSGTLKTVAGDGTAGFQGDGGPAIYAELDQPGGVCVDDQGDLYISDTLNDRIRKVDTSGNISTVVGDGMRGYNGNQGPALAATLDAPQGLCFDSSGALYFAEAANHVVRKVGLNGVVTTLAGNGSQGDSGDGNTAVSAQLDTPMGVCVDGQGNVYIADAGSNSVRKVDPYGDISTVAGDGQAGYQGDQGGAAVARLRRPLAVALGPQGNLYIADSGNHVVRMVYLNGAITTVAGNGTAGTDDQESQATEAELGVPEGLAVDSAGDLYISDQANSRVTELNCP
ncbi:MAG: NHL repeat-containing protein [bacterium]